MGAWGMRIYEDDTALDVRDEFLERQKAGEDIDKIENDILREYLEGSPEEDQTVFLALACVELETGTLTESTKQKALEEISVGPYEELWGQGVGARKREFTLVKKYLIAYDGKPVRRKSWVVLQKSEKHEPDLTSSPENVNDHNSNKLKDIKIDDATWQILPDEYKELPIDKYMEIASAHMSCFVYWLIIRGYFLADSEDVSKDVGKVISGKMSIFDFMNKNMDYKLFSDNVIPLFRDFVVSYYSFKSKNRPRYTDDYSKIMLSDGRKELSFVPTEAERKKVVLKIDERLGEFMAKPNKTNIINSQVVVEKLSYVFVYGLMAIGAYSLVKWLINAIF